MEPGGSTSPQEKEKEKIEKEEKNPDEDEDEDETEEDEKKDNEEKDNEEKKIPGKTPPALVFLHYKVVSETDIIFEFSQPVSLVSLDLKPELMNFNVITSGNDVKIILTEKPEPALLIEVDLQVEDEYGKTDREQISFRTKNNSVPEMQINELCTEYSKPKAEFIEFKMLSGGNLGALRVFIAGNYKAPMVYEFAPVEVKAGEYVVLHLRKLEEACEDEYGEDLNKSGGKDSSPTARDFWVPGTSKLLRKTDAVYVLDQDDKVLDAVMMAEKPDPLWGNKYFTEAAKFLYDQNAWKSPAGKLCTPADAVISSATTLTRSICRDENVENTHTAADWYITVNSGSTPGKENNTKRFN